MELKVQRNELKAAVTTTKKALSKVIIQEERSHLLCKVEGSFLKISATNNDLKAQCVLSIENNEGKDFSFTVNPKTFEKLLTKMDADQVKIDLNQEDLVLKVYTTEEGSSFTSFQSFPPDKMLTIDDSLKEERKEYEVNRKILASALKYAFKYMAPLKEDQKMFDFITINKGIVFGANGSNKMGFLVFKAFADIKEFKVRKAAAPLLASFVDSLSDDEVKLIETEKNVGVESLDGSAHYSCLKSTVDTPNIPMQHVKSEGPYIKVDKKKLVKVIDRLVATSATATGSGIEISLCGAGETAYLDLNLVSSLKNNERIKVERVNDDDSNLSHVVEYNLFKNILTSFDSKKEVRLHISGNDKFFKLYESGEISENKYVAVSIGSYSKVVKQ